VYTVTLTVRDDDGGISVVRTTVQVAGVGVVDGVLYIVGTDERDDVFVRTNSRRDVIDVDGRFGRRHDRRRSRGQAEARIRRRYDATQVQRIEAILCGGNDRFMMDGGSDGFSDAGSDGGSDGASDGGADRRLRIPTSIRGGDGYDLLIGGHGPTEVDGGSGNDFIRTRAGNDVITDLVGHNVIHSGAGDDTVRTGDGWDWIRTAEGDDHVFAGDGNNVVDTGRGHDRVRTGSGHDSVRTGRGDDTVLAGAGHDYVRTDDGNDLLVGGDGCDVLLAGRGDDILIGGRGSDVLKGDRGSDLLIGGRTAYDDDEAALDDLFSEWTRAAHVMDKVTALRNGTGPAGLVLQPQETVFDDSARDYLDGGRGRDWYLAAVTGDGRDRIRKKAEDFFDQV
jgi:Ca2+-binding RTX toxin-like protein